MEEDKNYLTKENVDVRVCVDCWIEKPICEFSKSTPKRCKWCISIYNREYHEKNKERINEKKKEYMKSVFNITHPNYKKEYHSKRIKTDKEYSEKVREKRREYIHKHYESIRVKNKERWKLMWYNAVQLRAKRLIKKLWIRPNKCPICWFCSDIVAHHPDYTKWYEIVFCCKSCHNFIHNWTMECPQPINILHYKN